MRNHGGTKHKRAARPWRNHAEPLENSAAGHLRRAESWRNRAEPCGTMTGHLRRTESWRNHAEPCGTMTEPNRSTWAFCGKAMSLWLFHVWANRAEPSGTMTEPSCSVEFVLAWLSQNRPELLLHHLLIKILKKRRCGSLRRRRSLGSRTLL